MTASGIASGRGRRSWPSLDKAIGFAQSAKREAASASTALWVFEPGNTRRRALPNTPTGMEKRASAMRKDFWVYSSPATAGKVRRKACRLQRPNRRGSAHHEVNDKGVRRELRGAILNEASWPQGAQGRKGMPRAASKT